MSDVFSDRGPEPRGLSTQIFRRISWGAIFSGVLVALGVEIAFLLFGLFIGFRLSGGAARAWTWVWYFVTSFCALYIGGWVAARLAGNPNRANGMLHGFVTWGLTTVAAFAIMTSLFFRTVSESTALVQTAIVAATATQGAPLTAAEQAQRREQAADVTSRVQQQAPQPRNVAKAVSNLSFVLWIGLLVGIAGSLLGGAKAATRNIDFTAPTAP